MIKQGGRKYIFPTTTKKPGNPPNDIFCNILRATLNQGKVEINKFWEIREGEKVVYNLPISDSIKVKKKKMMTIKEMCSMFILQPQNGGS